MNDDKILIDVREPQEYLDYHFENSVNLPSTISTIEDYEQYRNKKITLICQSGRRATKVQEMLLSNGFEKVELVEEHFERIDKSNLVSKSKIWSVDRQFRMTLGVLLLIFLLGFHFVSEYFIIIPIILALGLTITSIIDRCYMRMMIAKMPWNKGNK